MWMIRAGVLFCDFFSKYTIDLDYSNACWSYSYSISFCQTDVDGKEKTTLYFCSFHSMCSNLRILLLNKALDVTSYLAR